MNKAFLLGPPEMLIPHFKLLTIRRDDDYEAMGQKQSR